MKKIEVLGIKELEKMMPEELENLYDSLWTYKRRVRVVIDYLKELE